MPPREPISSYDNAALREYFEEHLKEFWWRWRPWLVAVESVEPKITLGGIPVSIGGLKQAYRAITLTGRCGYAAREWVAPHEPVRAIGHIPKIQTAAGLDHLPFDSFVQKVGEECEEILKKHERLKFWIRRRLALLDYGNYGHRGLSAEFQKTAMSLREGMNAAIGASLLGPQASTSVAMSICANALNAAAQAAGTVLGRGACSVSANLMIPAPLPSDDGPDFQISGTATANRATAAAIWHGLAAEKCLVAVAETHQAQHLGFWIPLATGDRGANLPGAPTAYREMRGDAVFKDDLPPFSGFSEELRDRWRTYVAYKFQDRMFVSLPFLLPPRQPGGLEVVGAVLNVNALPAETDGWYRAHHPEWLDVTTTHVREFVEIAFNCIRIVYGGAGGQGLLDTGIQGWDSLPWRRPMALPGGQDAAGKLLPGPDR